MTTSPNAQIKRTTALVTVLAFALAASVALAQHGGPRAANGTAKQKAQKIGLEGYCAVCVIDARKWEPGRPEFQSKYDGVTYYFPNAAIKKKFDTTPAKYVPALGGDCTVCLAKMGKRVPGNIRHASIQNDRLFLFPSDAEKQLFEKNPAAYIDLDLALKGECIVCLAKFNKHVPGKPEFTVVHNGMRYLFPSAGEAGVFSKSPEQFVAATTKGKRTIQTSMQKGNAAAKLVRVSGMSACAACEFGVTPIANPDELGLAIKMQNGRVVVVENAHKLYPNIYAARYDGQNIQAEGEILKTDGRIAWLRPSSIRVLN